MLHQYTSLIDQICLHSTICWKRALYTYIPSVQTLPSKQEWLQLYPNYAYESCLKTSRLLCKLSSQIRFKTIRQMCREYRKQQQTNKTWAICKLTDLAITARMTYATKRSWVQYTGLAWTDQSVNYVCPDHPCFICYITANV